MSYAWRDVCQLPAVAAACGHVIGQQVIERVVDPGRGNNAVAFDAMAILHFDARDATVLYENLFDSRIGKDLATGRLDFRDYRVGNAP